MPRSRSADTQLGSVLADSRHSIHHSCFIRVLRLKLHNCSSNIRKEKATAFCAAMFWFWNTHTKDTLVVGLFTKWWVVCIRGLCWVLDFRSMGTAERHLRERGWARRPLPGRRGGRGGNGSDVSPRLLATDTRRQLCRRGE